MKLRNLFSSLLAAVALMFASVGVANAASVTITYTADNYTAGGWILNNSTSGLEAVLAPKVSDWRTVAVDNVNLAPGNYTIYFIVGNFLPGGGGNPAALLAQISGPVSGNTVTSTNWEFTSIFSTSWVPATSYGNNGGSNIWNTVNGGPVAGIGPTAQWIWASSNESPTAPQAGLLRGSFTVVPVPAAVWLLGSALIGAGFFSRRKAS